MNNDIYIILRNRLIFFVVLYTNKIRLQRYVQGVPRLHYKVTLHF